MDEKTWEAQVAAAWAQIDERSEPEFLELIEKLAAQAPVSGGAADFERACSFDSTGYPDRAVPLYQAALERGLTGERRRRAVIQMASSVRNLGRPEESIAAHRRDGQWLGPSRRRAVCRLGAGADRRRSGTHT